MVHVVMLVYSDRLPTICESGKRLYETGKCLSESEKAENVMKFGNNLWRRC